MIDVGPAMTQHVMKADFKSEDQSTFCQLTPEEGMNPSMQKEQNSFLTSVTDHWGLKTTIKDLGPVIVNLLPDRMSNDPWEDEDGPLFPDLDDEFALAKAAGDYFFNSEVFLPGCRFTQVGKGSLLEM